MKMFLNLAGTLLALITVIQVSQAAFNASLGASYEFTQTVVVRNNGHAPVGHRVVGTLEFEYLGSNWILARVKNAKTEVLIKKKSQPESYINHPSKLDGFRNDPFIFHWNDGKIEKIYFNEQEESSITDIKIGLVRALTTDEEESHEGCIVSTKVNPNEIFVEKSNCHIQPIVGPKVWGYSMKSTLKKTIGLKRNVLEYSSGVETYELRPTLSSQATLSLTSAVNLKCSDFSNDGPSTTLAEEQATVSKIEKQFNFKLRLKSIKSNDQKSSIIQPSFSEVVHEYQTALKDKFLGNSDSASAMLKCIESARSASIEDIYSTLKSKKNKKIVPQLLDILGAVQTNETHQAALRLLKLNGEKIEFDWCERYFWALSMSPNPRKNIIEELLRLVQTKHSNEKLWETLVLTLPAMVHRYCHIYATSSEDLIENTLRFLSENLKECKDDIDCQLIYLRGFVNIPETKALPVLLETVATFKGRQSVEALRAVQKMKVFDKQVIDECLKVFLANATYDSSARTIALDIILESRPSNALMSTVLSILGQNDSPRELKQYLLQRLDEISEKCPRFKKFVENEFKKRGLTNNYHVLAQGGLSTSFSRQFIGGSLSTTQEVLKGILKRGNVNVNLEHNNKLENVFTLGLFSSGLGSFVSSSSDATDESDLVIAGMQLTVIDVELRPFVFFNGQGELMGHVFSGTASSLTPAYQALLLLEDITLDIPLLTGSVARLEYKAGASVALSGKIEISLWNKNAQSLVQNKAGLAINAKLTVSNDFVVTQGEASLTIEPELHLSSEIEFYQKIALCLRLQQPDTVVTVASVAKEKLEGTKQKTVKTRTSTLKIPGKTYALNSKNNEMCNILQLGLDES